MKIDTKKLLIEKHKKFEAIINKYRNSKLFWEQAIFNLGYDLSSNGFKYDKAYGVYERIAKGAIYKEKFNEGFYSDPFHHNKFVRHND